MQNLANIAFSLARPLVISVEFDKAIVIDAIDIDIIDGRIYRIDAMATNGDGSPVAPMVDANPHRPVVFAAIDALLQTLGVSIPFDFSSDSADYDYGDDAPCHSIIFELGSDDVSTHANAITAFCAVPGSILSHDNGNGKLESTGMAEPVSFTAPNDVSITVDEWGLGDGSTYCVAVTGFAPKGSNTVLAANIGHAAAIECAQAIAAAITSAAHWQLNTAQTGFKPHELSLSIGVSKWVLPNGSTVPACDDDNLPVIAASGSVNGRLESLGEFAPFADGDECFYNPVYPGERAELHKVVDAYCDYVMRIRPA